MAAGADRWENPQTGRQTHTGRSQGVHHEAKVTALSLKVQEEATGWEAVALLGQPTCLCLFRTCAPRTSFTEAAQCRARGCWRPRRIGRGPRGRECVSGHPAWRGPRVGPSLPTASSRRCPAGDREGAERQVLFNEVIEQRPLQASAPEGSQTSLHSSLPPIP